MSMHIDGKKVAAMYWGGRKIREAWYEGQVIWKRPTVTIEAESNNKGYATFLKETLHDPHGYVDKMGLFTNIFRGDRRTIAFNVPVTCDRDTSPRYGSPDTPAGATISAGETVYPISYGKYVFTPLEG